MLAFNFSLIAFPTVVHGRTNSGLGFLEEFTITKFQPKNAGKVTKFLPAQSTLRLSYGGGSQSTLRWSYGVFYDDYVPIEHSAKNRSGLRWLGWLGCLVIPQVSVFKNLTF